MEQNFKSPISIGEKINFKHNEEQKQYGFGTVAAVRFSKEKVFYDILDNYFGKIFEIDSLLVCEVSDNKITNDTEGASSYAHTAIAQLQSKVHKITGDGEVMQLFNDMLGINAS